MQIARLDGVTKRYGRTEGVRELDLDVGGGEVIGLLGLNGSGKTTLLKLLAGLLFPTSGSVRVLERPARAARADVVYLGEGDALWGWMTPRDAERLFAGLYVDFDAGRFGRLCESLAVPRRTARAMSKGERGRLRLAMALSRSARLYLLDEPLAGIDLLSRERILRSIVQEWHGDETILLSTHEVAEAEGLFERVLYMKEGRVVLDAQAEELRERGRSVVETFREVLS
ncbi:MAG: ABC transporter ATP-binding protein [Candidatus Bipolaricaulota bacterium]